MTGIKPGGPISATARLLGLSQTFPDRCASCIRRRHDLTVGCRSGFEATDFLPLVASIQVWQSAISLQNMRGKTLRQAPPNVDDAVAEIDLHPGQSDDLGDPQPVTEGQEDRRGVALAPAAALFGGGNQPVDLIRGQEFAPPALGVPAAPAVAWSTRPQVSPAAAVAARRLFHFGCLIPVSCSRVCAPLGPDRPRNCSIRGSLWNSSRPRTRSH